MRPLQLSINDSRTTKMPSTRSQARTLLTFANAQLLYQANPILPFKPTLSKRFKKSITSLGWSHHDIVDWVLGPATPHLRAWKSVVIDDEDRFPDLRAALGSHGRWQDLDGIMILCGDDEILTADEGTLDTRELTARAAVRIASASCSNAAWNAAFRADEAHCQSVALLLLLTAIHDMDARPVESWFLANLGGRPLVELSFERMATATMDLSSIQNAVQTQRDAKPKRFRPRGKRALANNDDMVGTGDGIASRAVTVDTYDSNRKRDREDEDEDQLGTDRKKHKIEAISSPDLDTDSPGPTPGSSFSLPYRSNEDGTCENGGDSTTLDDQFDMQMDIDMDLQT